LTGHFTAVVTANTAELVNVMKHYIVAIGALALITSAAPAIAQTVPYSVPYGQTAALPPVAAPVAPTDPNAAHWVQLQGYGGDGLVHEYWNLVTPHEFDVTNYHGFHTATD
jgi:hypothetical protein